ncbi:MAG: preprotein translocase subunit SecA [Clostridiales bacterium]|nr:preprotein translocase subunit SecA [Clostridiales bacterium]
MNDFLKRLLGDSNDREVARLMKQAARIDALEPDMQRLSDTQMAEKTVEFKKRLADGQTLDDLLPEAFALVREAAVRTVGQRHFETQLAVGVVLHQGRIAEMRTGEGKTLAATLPAYLNALTGQGVHIVTVNDYLARRDSQWMGKIYRFLGMRVGLVVSQMDPALKRESYAADITYGTNNEYGFDYLRDNMVIHRQNMVQRELSFAIIDEVDSILIDEARTPLIISGEGEKTTELYDRVDRFVGRLKAETDYETDEKMRSVTLTEDGVRKAEQHFGVENLSDMENTELNHHINQALKAHVLMHRDRDYVVQNDEVIIVDEFTGRLMIGRRYSDGLHQAIEAKERVNVRRESRTLATITFQNYFRMYKKLAGMTGTAKTEEEEFKGIYGLDVVVIPTHRPMIRNDYNDVIYRTTNGKFAAVVEEVAERHAKGQPVLVGTVSVEKSEQLSLFLKRRGIPHEVLNAKYHEKEAEIVAQAGKLGAVTIATNMAGRGTDIMLGGNPDFLARREMRQRGIEERLIEEAVSHAETEDAEILEARAIYAELFAKHKKVTDAEHDQVVEVGGLHIIGTERHESRRIDNQLRGRSGRQGDPGSSRFYVGLDDDLMRLFGGERVDAIVSRLGMTEDMPIEYGILSRQIENAQKKVEGRNYGIRKHVLQYDDVMNTQRGIIYEQRRQVLEGKNLRDSITDMTGELIDRAVDSYAAAGTYPEEWDMDGLLGHFERLFLPKGYLTFTQSEMNELNADKLKERLRQAAAALYEAREKTLTDAGIDMREVERVVLLRVVDRKWMDHIDAMDQLRQGIGLRAFGQRDPVVEYKFEGFDMFEAMTHAIQEDAVSMLYHLNIEKAPQRQQVARPVTAGRAESEDRPRTPVRADKKVGRNDPCPCGSGKKFKNCCGRQ